MTSLFCFFGFVVCVLFYYFLYDVFIALLLVLELCIVELDCCLVLFISYSVIPPSRTGCRSARVSSLREPSGKKTSVRKPPGRDALSG